jgi:hypothetical protein
MYHIQARVSKVTSFANRAGGLTPGPYPKERGDKEGQINYRKTIAFSNDKFCKSHLRPQPRPPSKREG